MKEVSGWYRTELFSSPRDKGEQRGRATGEGKTIARPTRKMAMAKERESRIVLMEQEGHRSHSKQ